MISGRADSLAGFYNDQSPTIEARTGKKMEQIRYADHGVNFFSTGLVASDAMLKKDPQLAKDFFHAAQRSWTEAAKHEADAVAAEAKLAENAPPKDVMAKQFADHAGPAAHAQDEGPADRRERPEPTGRSTIAVVTKYLGLKNPGKPDAYWDASISK